MTDPRSLERIHMCFHHNAHYALMAYFVLFPNGEESLNKLFEARSGPDLDHITGGPNHVHITSCVKKTNQSEQ